MQQEDSQKNATRVTSATAPGRRSSRCCRAPRSGALVSSACAKSSMRSSISCRRAASGVSCRATFLPGRQCTMTSIAGGAMEPGSVFMTGYALGYGNATGVTSIRAPGVWTTKASRPRRFLASAAMTPARRSRAANAIFWSIPWGWCWPSLSPPPACKTVMGRANSCAISPVIAKAAHDLG